MGPEQGQWLGGQPRHARGALPATAEERYALGAGGTLVIEGSLAGNAHFAPLLANWGAPAGPAPPDAIPVQIQRQRRYQLRWRARVAQIVDAAAPIAVC